jgi:hypothetical protein
MQPLTTLTSEKVFGVPKGTFRGLVSSLPLARRKALTLRAIEDVPDSGLEVDCYHRALRVNLPFLFQQIQVPEEKIGLLVAPEIWSVGVCKRKTESRSIYCSG